MANQLYNQLSQNLQQQMINNLMSNPQYTQIMNEIKSSGMSPKDYFYQKTKQMGIDPQSILSQLTQFR